MLLANSVAPDKSVRMRSLIWGYTGRKCNKGHFLIKRLKCIHSLVYNKLGDILEPDVSDINVIYEPFYEKRSLIAFPISVDPDKPSYPNYISGHTCQMAC